MKLIFFAVAGRSGSNYLTYLFNKFGKDCFSECEAPDLIFKNNWVFGTLARNFQRKWIVTDEMLGRGKALEWYELDRTHDKLNKIGVVRNFRIIWDEMIEKMDQVDDSVLLKNMESDIKQIVEVIHKNL